MIEQNVLIWAQQKGILEKATVQTQALKLKEEVFEFVAEYEKNDILNAKMELGDVAVVCTILCKMLNRNISQVLSNSNSVYLFVQKSTNKDLLINETELLLTSINCQNTENVTFHLANIILLSNLFAEKLNVSFDFCLKLAYEKIINRKGKMINGTFVKEN